MSNYLPERVLFKGPDHNRLVADSWGDGPPVLLLHGGGQTRHAWHATAERLAAIGCRAIAIDMRGHGDSDWSSARPYTMQAHVYDLMAICETLDERPTLVGASMGGLTAMIALGQAPDGGASMARTLVLVDITPRLEAAGIGRIFAFMVAFPNGFATLDEAADAVAAYLPGRPRPSSTAGLAKNLRLGEDSRYRWHWDPRILADMNDDPLTDHGALADLAGAVTVPTLLVRGRRSDVVSAEGVRELRELIPHSEIAEVAEAGHMVAGDDNTTFSGAIADFIGRHIDMPPSTGITIPVM